MYIFPLDPKHIVRAGCAVPCVVCVVCVVCFVLCVLWVCVLCVVCVVRCVWESASKLSRVMTNTFAQIATAGCAVLSVVILRRLCAVCVCVCAPWFELNPLKTYKTFVRS